jgi:plasmid maintenance system antidote protein VapI
MNMQAQFDLERAADAARDIERIKPVRARASQHDRRGAAA